MLQLQDDQRAIGRTRQRSEVLFCPLSAACPCSLAVGTNVSLGFIDWKVRVLLS